MKKFIVEREKQVPVDGEYDVIVCGGGPAGVSAALSAAREGARTLLLENGGCLGGVWTAGLLSYVLDNGGKSGLLEEIRHRLANIGGYLDLPHPPSLHYDGQGDFTYDAEMMKAVLEAMCAEAGVEVHLHTRVTDAVRQGRRIEAAVTESCSGRRAFLGRVFVDCTGNGEFAARSGCGFAAGHPRTGQTQPATLLAIVSGFPPEQVSTLTAAAKGELRRLIGSGGFETSYRTPALFRLPHPELACIMLNHQYAVPCDSAKAISDATMEARKEVHGAVRALARAKGWERLRLVSTAEHIGIREGRRIHGLYEVSVEDMMRGAEFADAVCTVRLPIDIHALDPGGEGQDAKQGIITRPYQIPLRSLIARDVDNLAMAGRCVSGDFYAHASYRVTGNSVPMGEAAGLAAAHAVRSHETLLQVEGGRIKAEMANRGYVV